MAEFTTTDLGTSVDLSDLARKLCGCYAQGGCRLPSKNCLKLAIDHIKNIVE